MNPMNPLSDSASNTTATDCIFCRIASGEIPARIEYQDSSCIAFQDANPQAPVHLLVIPREHIGSAREVREDTEVLFGHLHHVAAKLADKLKLADGYRAVMNTGAAAGQTVFHVHLHLLGGRAMNWPPG